MLRLARMRGGLHMSLRWMSRSASGAELSPEVVASMLTAAIQGGDGATASMVVADAARSGHLTASMANRGIEDCLEQGLLGAAVSFHATARDNEVHVQRPVVQALFRDCVDHMEWEGAASALLHLIEKPAMAQGASSSSSSSSSSGSRSSGGGGVSFGMKNNDVGKVLGGLCQHLQNKPLVLDVLSALAGSRSDGLVSHISFGRIRRTSRAFGYWAVKPDFLARFPSQLSHKDGSKEAFNRYRARLNPALERARRACLGALGGGGAMQGVAGGGGWGAHDLIATIMAVGDMKDRHAKVDQQWSLFFLRDVLEAYDQDASLDTFALLDSVARAVDADHSLKGMRLAVLQALALHVHHETRVGGCGGGHVHTHAHTHTQWHAGNVKKVFTAYWKLAHELENKSMQVLDAPGVFRTPLSGDAGTRTGGGVSVASEQVSPGARAAVVGGSGGGGAGAGAGAGTGTGTGGVLDRAMAATLGLGGGQRQGTGRLGGGGKSAQGQGSDAVVEYVRTSDPSRGRNSRVTDLSDVTRVYAHLREIIGEAAAGRHQRLDIAGASAYQRRLYRVLLDELDHPHVSQHRLVVKAGRRGGSPLECELADMDGNLDLSVWTNTWGDGGDGGGGGGGSSRQRPRLTQPGVAEMGEDVRMRSLEDVLVEDVRRDASEHYKGGSAGGGRGGKGSALPPYLSRSGRARVPGAKGMQKPHGSMSRQLEGYPLYWAVMVEWLDSLDARAMADGVTRSANELSVRHSSSAWGLLVLDLLITRLHREVADGAADGDCDLSGLYEDMDGLVSSNEQEYLCGKIGSWAEKTVVMASRRKDAYAVIEVLRAMAAAGLSEYITYGTVVRASQTVWACRHPADRLQKRQFRTANYELWLLLAQLPAHLQLRDGDLLTMLQNLVWTRPLSDKTRACVDALAGDAGLRDGVGTGTGMGTGYGASAPDWVENNRFVTHRECAAVTSLVLRIMRCEDALTLALKRPLYKDPHYLYARPRVVRGLRDCVLAQVEEVGGLTGLANALEQAQRHGSGGGGSGGGGSAAAATAVHTAQQCLIALDHPLYRDRVAAEVVSQRWLLVSAQSPPSSSSSSSSSSTELGGGGPGLDDMGMDSMEMDSDTPSPGPPAFVLLALHSAADASAHGHHRLALRLCVNLYQLLMDTLDLESLTVAQRANPRVVVETVAAMAAAGGGDAAAEPADAASAAAEGAAYYYGEEESGDDDYDEDYEFDNDDDDDGSDDGDHGEGGGRYV